MSSFHESFSTILAFRPAAFATIAIRSCEYASRSSSVIGSPLAMIRWPVPNTITRGSSACAPA